MEYATNVYVKQFDKEAFFEKYLKAEIFSDACKLCPYHGKIWSCPPDIPSAQEVTKDQNAVFLLCIQVIYSDHLRSLASSADHVQEIRDCSYERVKRYLLLALLELEQKVDRGLAMGAGRCILCRECTRTKGKPCIHPELCRYSITGFGFDCGALLRDEFQIPLKWGANHHLPEYDVALAALFYHQ